MKPNPGTKEAIDTGCTCPVIDNHYGKGIMYDGETEPVFWHSDSCPIHGIDIAETIAKELLK